MKKNLFSILVLSLIVMLIVAMHACNNPNKSDQAPVVDTASCAFDPVLYPLYDTCGPGTKFNALVDSVYHKDDIGKNMNIIFQFFHRKDGRLTLSVYAGKRNYSKFDEKNEFKLRIYDTCHPTKPSMTNRAFYLADLELDSLDQKIDVLRNYTLDSTNKYIVFMPSIEPIPNMMNQDKIIKYAIYYNIYPIKDLAEICDSISIFGTGTTGLSTNPSPPHGGN